MGLVRTEKQESLGDIKVGTNDLFVICDGVGGLPNGALASKTAVDSIISDFSMISAGEPATHLQSREILAYPISSQQISHQLRAHHDQ